MSEDRFKGTGEFHPQKSWAKIVSADRDRKLDALYPMKLRHYALIVLAGLSIIALPILVVSFFFDLPALLRF